MGPLTSRRSPEEEEHDPTPKGEGAKPKPPARNQPERDPPPKIRAVKVTNMCKHDTSFTAVFVADEKDEDVVFETKEVPGESTVQFGPHESGEKFVYQLAGSAGDHKNKLCVLPYPEEEVDVQNILTQYEPGTEHGFQFGVLSKKDAEEIEAIHARSKQISKPKVSKIRSISMRNASEVANVKIVVTYRSDPDDKQPIAEPAELQPGQTIVFPQNDKFVSEVRAEAMGNVGYFPVPEPKAELDLYNVMVQVRFAHVFHIFSPQQIAVVQFLR